MINVNEVYTFEWTECDYKIVEHNDNYVKLQMLDFGIFDNTFVTISMPVFIDMLESGLVKKND